MKTRLKYYPLATRIASKAFLIGLLGLSLLSSSLLLTDNLNNIEQKYKLQDAQLADVELQAERRLTLLQEQQAYEREQFKSQQKQSIDRLNAQIDELTRLMQLEMGNVVNGIFKGKRYLEYEAQRAARMQEQETLRGRQLEELHGYENSLTKAYQQHESDIHKQEEEQKRAVIADFNPDDPRVNDKMVVSFLKALESIRPPWIPTASQFIFLFALLLSSLMELGIILAFENVMLTLAPILKLRFQGELEQELLKTQLDNEQGKQGIQHEADLDAIRRKANQTVEKAKTWVEGGILNT
ncbi:hypothetical protein [Thiothrix eikelboomii]|uniref:hypothetical protein n=1 Tax=Thiothrix eikelboomii TaxID=92487 RepID=UPI003BB20000